MKALFSILSAIISLVGIVPYIMDIQKGRVKPARSARIMFVFLTALTLLQQYALHSGWLMAVTVGEFSGAIALLWLALRHGRGGLTRLDVACYMLLIVDVAIWLTSHNALLALHLTVLADLIAFTPTLHKTWRDTQSETVLFFVSGVVGPLVNIVGVGKYAYAIVLFPAYLALANAVEVVLITSRKTEQKLLN
jgi:hypothetical protein